ncbi:MAG: RNA methyltransferase [Nitrospirota bacterium]|nr:MAG: RNA methyltransferase [Nitrospirota bacterium]
MSSLSNFPRTITSSHNVQLKRWTSLLDSRGLTHHQQCLVSGKKLVRQILVQFPKLCLEILYPTLRSPILLTPQQVTHFRLTPELFRKLDLIGTRFPLLVCQIPPITLASLATPPRGLEVLCPFGDPTNVGAIIRSSCAFNVTSLILLREAAHPFHPKSIRASSGAVFHQGILQGPGVAELHKKEVLQWITALDVKGGNLSSWKWPKNIRLLIGEEGVGLSKQAFPRILAIPQTKKANSLNAAIAASIALYSYRQQHPLAGC